MTLERIIELSYYADYKRDTPDLNESIQRIILANKYEFLDCIHDCCEMVYDSVMDMACYKTASHVIDCLHHLDGHVVPVTRLLLRVVSSLFKNLFDESQFLHACGVWPYESPQAALYDPMRPHVEVSATVSVVL